jgi:hypothetical protein
MMVTDINNNLIKHSTPYLRPDSQSGGLSPCGCGVECLKENEQLKVALEAEREKNRIISEFMKGIRV